MNVKMMLMALVMALAVVAPAAGEMNSDVPNTTCRIDAAATGAAAGAEISCLQLDTDTHGEFDGLVTVTLQVRQGDGWVDAAQETCSGRSVEGALVLPCQVAAPEAAEQGEVRGVVDLKSPKDWEPAVAHPTYTGGRPIPDPLAIDECDVNETADRFDLTLSDAPWVDLCAVTMASAVDERGQLESLTVVIHVWGGLEQRLPTGSWRARFRVEEGCTHEVIVTDDGFVGVASAHLHSGCDYEAGECGPISQLLTELTGGVCASSGTWGEEQTMALSLDDVTLIGDEVRVVLTPDAFGPLAARDLRAGAVIRNVRATTATGVGAGENGTRGAVVDVDMAYSTGRTFSVGAGH